MRNARAAALLLALLFLLPSARADTMYTTFDGFTTAPSDERDDRLLMTRLRSEENGMVVEVDARCALIREDGGVRWNVVCGGNGEDELCWAVPRDECWMAAGVSASSDLDNGWHEGWYDEYEPRADGWLVCLDRETGATRWSRCYGGSSWDGFAGVCSAPDGEGLVMAGSTYSGDGDVKGYHPFEFADQPDGWVVRVDAQGEIVWQRCLGGTGNDAFTDIRAVPQGYLAVGYTDSWDGAAGETHGDRDGWVVLLSDEGEVLAEFLYGDYEEDAFLSMTQGPDGYLLVGYSWSKPEGFVSEGAFCAGWTLLVDENGKALRETRLEGGGHDRVTRAVWKPGEGYLLTGTQQTQGVTDTWLVLMDAETGEWHFLTGGA